SAALVPKQEGDYNYIHGLMLSQTNINEAEKHFRKAEELGLSMSTDMAMTKLNLAGIAMTKNRRNEEEKLMGETKKIETNKQIGQTQYARRTNKNDARQNENGKAPSPTLRKRRATSS